MNTVTFLTLGLPVWRRDWLAGNHHGHAGTQTRVITRSLPCPDREVGDKPGERRGMRARQTQVKAKEEEQDFR